MDPTEMNSDSGQSIDAKLVFISHNRADKVEARLLATALIQQGVGVWFDEWSLNPGESITGGIQAGLSDADVFVLVWSGNAAQSNWVDTELRAYLRRRVDDQSLRIIPVMLDDTPLPVLAADYKGFRVDGDNPLESIAAGILGFRPDREIARLLQSRLLDLSEGGLGSIDPLPYLVCPECGSTNLQRGQHIDEKRDDTYMVIWCDECKWGDSTEI